MLKIENVEVVGLEHAIRGMRNPKNSWDRSDTVRDSESDTGIILGGNDYNLMIRLAARGSVHAKFRRMIAVYADITAPLYWWKEFDTYKVGTVANSCSTMHKIHAKEFTLEDFSTDQFLHLGNNDPMDAVFINGTRWDALDVMEVIIKVLNYFRDRFIRTKEKCYWWQMIQLLPSSYNQKRTVMLNYEVLANIYQHRRDHKLDEWRKACEWIERLPYNGIITKTAGEEDKASGSLHGRDKIGILT